MLLNYFLGKKPFLNARVPHERLATLLQERRRYYRLESQTLPSLVRLSTQEMAHLKWAADAIRHTGYDHQAALLDIVIAKPAAIGPLLRKRPSVSRTTRHVTVSRRPKKTLR